MVNRVVLTGRLCADPEHKTTAAGKSICNLRIAVDRKGREKETDFFDATAFGQVADFVATYIKKGRMVGIDGKLRTREYDAKDGTRRKVYEIVVDDVTALDRPKEGDPGGFTEQSGGVKPVAKPQTQDISDPFEDYEPHSLS